MEQGWICLVLDKNSNTNQPEKTTNGITNYGTYETYDIVRITNMQKKSIYPIHHDYAPET